MHTLYTILHVQLVIIVHACKRAIDLELTIFNE